MVKKDKDLLSMNTIITNNDENMLDNDGQRKGVTTNNTAPDVKSGLFAV